MEVDLSRIEDIQALKELCAPTKNVMEDWSTSVRIICKQCSEGKPHEHHDKDLENTPSMRRTIAIATKNYPEIDDILKSWVSLTKTVIHGVADDTGNRPQ